MTGQPPWLAEAWRELGQSEVAGPRHNPRITAFFKELGHEAYARDEVAWCAAFVGACLERAGIASTRSLMARSYTQFGEPLTVERLGSLVVLTRGPNPAFGHVGFLVGWSPEKLWLLGGNQADSVRVAGYDRSRLVALRWPRQLSDAGRPALNDVFTVSIRHVLEMEGGYTDDPHDPGGPTNKGITLATLAAWRKIKLDSAARRTLIADLRDISDEEVNAIYLKRYWQPAGCPDLEAPLALFHFDASVNHGVRGAIGMLQEAAGADVDGEIGPQTKRKIKAMSILKLLALYAAIRRKRYRGLPHFWKFGRGWLRRVEHTLKAARRLASEDRAHQGNEVSNSNPNGERQMTTQEQGDAKWWGQSMTIWGAMITAAAAVLPTLGPVIGLDITAAMVRELGEQVLNVVQAVTVLIGTMLTIYGRSRAALPLSRRSVTLKL